MSDAKSSITVTSDINLFAPHSNQQRLYGGLQTHPRTRKYPAPPALNPS